MTDVSSKSLGRPVLYALILLGLYLSYLVLSPFLVALTWAVMFAILFRRMQAALAARIGSNRAAVVTTLVVGVVIVAPAVVLISAVARQAPQVADYVTQTSRTAPHQIQRIWDAVRARSPFPIPEAPADFMTQGAQRAVAFLRPRAGAFVTDLFATLGNLGAMIGKLFIALVMITIFFMTVPAPF